MPRMFFILVAFSLLHVLVSAGLADEKDVLDRHFIAGDFRIFYTLEGRSAVPADDRDGNGVPDKVEDFAKQLVVAHRLFCEVLEFPNPLNSKRYLEADCIQVSLKYREKGNGTAFDEPSRARQIPGERPARKSLTIAIGNHVDPTKNVTPAHEYFHLVQYSATYFKNSWYLEGMTRWSEHAVGLDGLGDVRYPENGPWPQQSSKIDELFQMSYDAERVLWNPIAKAVDAQGALPTDDTLRELATYRYSNGEPVLQDMRLTGAAVMREILLELDQQDDIAFQELQYDRWSEENQRSAQNNRYIYQAVMNVLRRHLSDVGPYDVR